MIQPLRTCHRRVFIALAILLPAVFVAALTARHSSAAGRSAGRAFFFGGNGSTNHYFAVQLSPESNGGYLARLLLLKPLPAPDLLVYYAENASRQDALDANARLLGKYDVDSSYPIPASGSLILYSPAHKSVVDSYSYGGRP